MTAEPLRAIPDTAIQPKPKKSAARVAEADDGYITIEQCGVTLHLPVKGKVPLRAYLLYLDGQEFKGTEALLGPEQWAEFLAANPTLDDYSAVAEKIKEAAGNL